ncbi:MAG TPA: D-alanine--D-alanine ligase A [Chloroflexi bacterium]|nr:D-alanine--D-alanine ligase A [Chloroflexota bacterium]
MNSKENLQIGVLFGGRSGEHEVSLMSARSVLGALDPEKYAIIQIGITHEGTWLAGDNVHEAMLSGNTAQLKPVTYLPDPTRKGLHILRETEHGTVLDHFADIDVFIPVLHGTFGEDGTLQGLFELAGVAYVGAGVLGAAVGMDKAIFKDVMTANGIPVVEGFVVSRGQLQNQPETVLDRAEALGSYPLFTKPANMGSSVGVTKCRNRSDLYEGLLDAARFDRRILIERGINAREIEISVLGNADPIASIPGEIRPAADFYSYEAKYHDDRSELFIPAPIPTETAEWMRATAIRAYRAIDCAGMARVDFLLDRDTGEFYLNEVNTIPGFTQISMYPKLWEASGLPYPQLIDRLIELALERRRERDQTEWRYER